MIHYTYSLFHSYKPPKFNLINFFLVAFLVYVCVVYRYAFNFPYLDDYDAILGFSNQYSLTHGIDSFWTLLGQHNEHRIFLTHLFTVITLKIFGEINFSALIFLGNTGWLLVILIFWRYAKQQTISFTEFLPVPIALLTFSHWGMMTWAMTSIQQYWQILFCLLCIYNLCKGCNFFAILFFVLAIFTGGGGLVLAPLVTLYFFNRREWTKTIIAIFIIFLLLYVYFYALPYSPPGASKLLDSIAHPLRFFAFFFGFLGGAFNLHLIGLFSYISVGAILFYLTLKNFRKIRLQNDFLSWTLYFILMCALLGAINRSDLGIDGGGASHYSVYSLLLVSSLYLQSIVSLGSSSRRRVLAFYGIFSSVLLFSYWAWKAPFYLEDRYFLLKNGYIIYPDKKNAIEMLDKSKSLRLYISPVAALDS